MIYGLFMCLCVCAYAAYFKGYSVLTPSLNVFNGRTALKTNRARRERRVFRNGVRGQCVFACADNVGQLTPNIG